MNTYFLVRKFPSSIHLTGSDTLTCRLLDEGDDGEEVVLAEVSETVSVTCTLAYAIFFRIEKQAIGAIFGDERTIADVREGRVFVNAIEVETLA